MNYKMMPTKEDDFDGINNNNNDSSSVDNNNVNMTTTTNNNNINSYCSNIGNDSINNNNSNNSNDNFNGNTSSSSSKNQNSNNGMSKAELRKSNKPIMEKRRRARINHCLNELKTLILEAMKKDPARHTKLEKADILEMTVKHLQSIQRQQLSLAMQTDPTVIHKFKSGFSECAEEVNRYISQLDGIEPSVQQRLSNHLNNCATGLEQLGTFSNFSNVYRPANSTLTAPYNVASPVFPLPQDVNNNGRIQMGGVQLIPSRLPSGEIALIMPNTNNVPFFLPNIQSHTFDTFTNTFSRMSAFSKPTPTSSTVSGGCGVTGGIGNGRSNTNTVVTQTMTTTTTPPLSPVSSVSSVGDDSMQTSSDFQTKTPPPQILMNQSFSGIFPTPPSAENSTKFISHTGTGHLQQPLVSSTSETQTCIKSESEAECAGSKTATMITPIRKRRSSSDSYSIDEPCNKLYRRESSFMDSNGNSTTKSATTTATATVAGTVDNSLTGEGSNDNMWRPW